VWSTFLDQAVLLADGFTTTASLRGLDADCGESTGWHDRRREGPPGATSLHLDARWRTGPGVSPSRWSCRHAGLDCPSRAWPVHESASACIRVLVRVSQSTALQLTTPVGTATGEQPLIVDYLGRIRLTDGKSTDRAGPGPRRVEQVTTDNCAPQVQTWMFSASVIWLYGWQLLGSLRDAVETAVPAGC